MGRKEELQQANINRSIRTIKAELEYLCDASIITPAALADLLQRVPPQTALHAPLSVGAVPSSAQDAGKLQSPASSMQNLSLGQNNKSTSTPVDEKAPTPYQPPAQPPPQAQPPPPAYTAPPPQAQWPPLAQATAMYPYNSPDAGDMNLQPNDHITVTQYMNAEWWKGRNGRTGQEGIFPRSYVRVLDEKAPPPQANQYASYGNAPMEVAQGNNQAAPQQEGGESKIQEQGKKFGKKLGNATIFGAGATLGGNMVNSIF